MTQSGFYNFLASRNALTAEIYVMCFCKHPSSVINRPTVRRIVDSQSLVAFLKHSYIPEHGAFQEICFKEEGYPKLF